MNFLEICKQVKEEAGLSNTALASVSGATGMDKKVVSWVRHAWERIQAQYLWRTLQAELTFNTTIGKRVYSVTTDLSHTDVRAFDTSIAKIVDGATTNVLTWQDYYTEFRPKYFFAAPVSTRPQIVTYTAFDNSIQFDATPDAAYIVALPYYMTAEKLAADADVPTLPEELHWLIVWRAVMLYAAYDNAPGLYQNASANYEAMLFPLSDMIGPVLITAEPLA